ncbi:MAG: hypothetical protein ACFFA0_14235 [Promethearchaeota archaeon]
MKKHRLLIILAFLFILILSTFSIISLVMGITRMGVTIDSSVLKPILAFQFIFNIVLVVFLVLLLLIILYLLRESERTSMSVSAQ